MQIGVSNPNVPIFLPRVCTLVLFTSARAVLSAPPKFSPAMSSVEDITSSGGYAD